MDGKYNQIYLIDNLYIFKGYYKIDIPYVKQGVIFPSLNTKYFSETFAKYEKANTTPLLVYGNYVKHELNEIFTNLPIGWGSNNNKGPEYSKNYQGNYYKLPDNYDFDAIVGKNAGYRNNEICSSALGTDFHYSYSSGDPGYYAHGEPVYGTKKLDALRKLSDNPYAKASDLTFNNHIRRMHALFYNSCVAANLPYKTLAEYNALLEKQERDKKYLEELNNQKKFQSNQDEAQATLILRKYSK